MISSTLLTLVVIPAVYSLWKQREVTPDATDMVEVAEPAELALAS